MRGDGFSFIMKSLIKFIVLITFFPFVLMTYNNCGEGTFKANRSINSRVNLTLSLLEKPESFTKSNQARFVFQARSQGSGIKEIQCKIDNGAYGVCSSPKLLNNLSEGNHSFSIKAVNQAGGTSDVISHQWTVDTRRPTLRITSHPEETTGYSSASFTFQAGDTGSGLREVQCKVDREPYRQCYNPISLNHLSEGVHTIMIRGGDKAGNSSSVASYQWNVDLSIFGSQPGCLNRHSSIESSDTKNAYPTQILSGKGSHWYYVAWVWRNYSGAENNHSLSVMRSRDLINWFNTCGESLSMPISSSSKTVLDPLPTRSGLGNNIKLGFDSSGNPIITYHKYRTIDGRNTTQIYNAYFINNKWEIHQMTDWTLLYDYSGGGSLPGNAKSDSKFGMSDVKVTPDGRMYQGLRRSSDNNSNGSSGYPEPGTWFLNYTGGRLRVTEKVTKDESGHYSHIDTFQSFKRKSVPNTALTSENSSFNGKFRSKRVWASYDSRWIYVNGDWDNDGSNEPGLFDRNWSKFYLYMNNGSRFGTPLQFGNISEYFWPLVGDWGDGGSTSIGLWSPSQEKSYLKEQLTSGPADQVLNNLPPDMTDSPLVWHEHRPDLLYFIKYDVMPGNRDRGYNCDGTKREDREIPESPGCLEKFHTKLYLYEYDVTNERWGREFIDDAWGGAKVRFGLRVLKNIKIIVYYDTDRRIKVALKKENLPWEKQVIDSNMYFDGWDAHNYLSAYVDIKSNIHITGNMHADEMKYWVSNGLSLTSFSRQSLEQDPKRVTYPKFVRNHRGTLLFLFRVGGSGNGYWRIIRYNEFTGTWSTYHNDKLFDKY